MLPRWHSYSRKYQDHKGFEPRQKGQKLVQIWAGPHLTVPSEQQKTISNQYLQIFVIYLDNGIKIPVGRSYSKYLKDKNSKMA